MQVEALLAVGAFVGLFSIFVVLPSWLHRRSAPGSTEGEE